MCENILFLLLLCTGLKEWEEREISGDDAFVDVDLFAPARPGGLQWRSAEISRDQPRSVALSGPESCTDQQRRKFLLTNLIFSQEACSFSTKG